MKLDLQDLLLVTADSHCYYILRGCPPKCEPDPHDKIYPLRLPNNAKLEDSFEGFKSLTRSVGSILFSRTSYSVILSFGWLMG